MTDSFQENSIAENIFSIDMKDFHPAISVKRIQKALGYPEELPPGIDKMILQAEKLARESSCYKAGYALLPVKILSAGSIKIGSAEVHPQKQITGQLKQAEKLALFAATIGSGIEKWTSQTYSKEEPALSYIIDTIGSIMAEDLANKVHLHIIAKMKKSGYSGSNRYSPGYCGWDVQEQKELFSLLPKDFCGIGLSDSAFMEPRKSVNGIIGIGKDIKWNDYDCKTCKNKSCLLAVK